MFTNCTFKKLHSRKKKNIWTQVLSFTGRNCSWPWKNHFQWDYFYYYYFKNFHCFFFIVFLIEMQCFSGIVKVEKLKAVVCWHRPLSWSGCQTSGAFTLNTIRKTALWRRHSSWTRLKPLVSSFVQVEVPTRPRSLYLTCSFLSTLYVGCGSRPCRAQCGRPALISQQWFIFNSSSQLILFSQTASDWLIRAHVL